MHVAVGNYWLLAQAGVKPGGPHRLDKIPPDAKKQIETKSEVVRWLLDSLAAVRCSHGSVEGSKKLKFLGSDVTAGDVVHRILVGKHEHIGQALAYARMSGVTPPEANNTRSRKFPCCRYTVHGASDHPHVLEPGDKPDGR
jgi:hypothetical protein